MSRLGSEKVPYITRKEYDGIPVGTPCLVSRPDDELVIEFEDGTTIKPGPRFYAFGIEDPEVVHQDPPVGTDEHIWVEDTDHEKSVTEEGMGLFTMSLSVVTDANGGCEVKTEVAKKNWRCSRCGICVSAERPETYGDSSSIQVGGVRFETPDFHLKSCGEYVAMKVTDS